MHVATLTRPDAAPTPRSVLRAYFHAKDENRPQVMRQAFAPDATLDIVNRSASIAFPARTVGREAIADVLVRAFGRTYENVRTFYLGAPPPDAQRFSCDWLVAMSDKEHRCARVGCGRYDWTFDTPGSGLASGLVITIEAMLVLAPALLDATLEAIDTLDYPWTTGPAAAAALRVPPDLASALGPVLAWLEREAPAG
ncbi:MAG: nuclear transport factor 2 family protein [Burkholderiales bacterium]|nr:nuclear transport factor 2 family protein [Burkholderiales bacterium]